MILSRAGEHYIVLSVSYDKTRDCVDAIRSYYHLLKDHPTPAIVSLRPGLDSLLIELAEDAEADPVIRLLQEMPPPAKYTAPGELVRIPVRYDGRDLQSVAKACRLEPEEVIHMHSSCVYEVWMLGFMPGFPYLGELPQPLQLPRKGTPDARVAAGSVAIAEEYTGIYPFDSPGGWHIIGHTETRLVDYNLPEPILLHYGMRVQFVRTK